MNKRVKKLVLSRETLLNLSGKHLEGVHGGATAGPCGSGVPYCASGASDCNTCDGSCMSCWCTGSGCPPSVGC